MKHLKYIICAICVMCGLTACDNDSIDGLSGEFSDITFCNFTSASVQTTDKLGKGVEALNTSFTDAAGNTLTFEASAKPVRFSSIDIVIEKESGDIYELVRNTSQIQTGINYMLVGRANNTTMTGRALSIYNTDPNNPSTGNIKSTYVDLLDNGLRVRANDSVQFIHLGDALSEDVAVRGLAVVK